jgi:EAL domain-containing protein (putative c-di-GMP-specific phosphodiesterase class I)/CheY-like chemotaxis protein
MLSCTEALPDSCRITSILLVEDEPVTRQLIRRMLMQFIPHVNIVEAENGQAALDKLDLLHCVSNLVYGDDCPFGFDFILLDLMMPKMDGVEFLRSISKLAIKPTSQLVLLSASEPVVLQSTLGYAKMIGLEVIECVQKKNLVHSIQELANKMNSVLVPIANRAKVVSPFIKSTPGADVNREMLTEAIEQNQIEMVYQPKFSLHQSIQNRVEALARWLHPQHGVISPAIFIPLAEKEGLIDALTRKVVGRVMSDMATWKRTGLTDIHVSINLSSLSLDDFQLPEWLLAQATEYGIDPARVTFELTESVQEQDPGALMDVMLRLRLKGFTLSIDDFGTGTSSLARLQQLPFNELKIDRSFVVGIDRDDTKQSMVSHMVSMGHKLGLDVVIEGVETPQELAFIKTLDPEFVQGYIYSKPLAQEQTQAWFRQFLATE